MKLLIPVGLALGVKYVNRFLKAPPFSKAPVLCEASPSIPASNKTYPAFFHPRFQNGRKKFPLLMCRFVNALNSNELFSLRTSVC